MSQSRSTNPFLSLFDVQRTAIRQSQQALKQGIALQRTANRAALNGLLGQEALQRQGTEVVQAAVHGYLQSVAALTGADQPAPRPRAIDEQFARLKWSQSEIFATLERELERGVESFEALSAEYVDAVDEQTDRALDTLDTIEDQTADDLDQLQEQFGEQVREGFARTQEVQLQLEEQFEQGTDQAENLLRRQAAQTEKVQQQLAEQAETMQRRIEEGPGAVDVAVQEPGEPSGQPTGQEAAERQLEEIEGIGATFADRLREHGIETPADLATADVETVAEAADISEDHADEWIGEASH